MSDEQNTTATPMPAARRANWKTVLLRAAGFGGGFAIIAALLLGGVIWWTDRPKQWSDNSITAKPTELYTRQVDEEVRAEFHYAFTNNTNV
jgi:hypothetical protein